MDPHECKSNDHILYLAKKLAFNDWKKLWDANAELQKNRKSPNLLFKGANLTGGGDKLTLPEKETAEKGKGTDASHKFTANTTALFLRLRILNDDFTPLKDADYKLVIPGVTPAFERTGKTDAKGQIEQKIPADSQKGALTVSLPPPKAQKDGKTEGKSAMSWELEIGALNPVQEKAPDDNCVSGIQQRLNNLGFYCGEVTGVLDDGTKNQIKGFQEKYKLTTKDGTPSPETQGKLKDLHDKADADAKPPG